MPSQLAPRGTTNQKLNFWAMMNNVIITSLAKGQLLPILLFFAFITLVLKTPSQVAGQLLMAILSGLVTGKLLGYFLFIIMVGGWQWHLRWQRKGYEQRLRDMASARDLAQEHALPGLLESSNKPTKQKGRKDK
ncbi:MAG TPA: hypothetical protein VGN86_17340 [Pyrinomonadaceae bacterium]|jgi:hypothetical protein|nr:hypothetical protein [Pyrinomonadaceae bacterium]